MSDDFTWKPEPASRRQTIRVAVVLAFAGLGVVAGSLYPIKLVISAFERATPPRAVVRGNATPPAAQDAATASFSQATDKAQPVTTQPTEAPSQAGGRMVLLNPGSAAAITPEEPTAKAPSGRLWTGESNTKRQPSPPIVKSGDRNVLVVVRRRGPPYDTKVLSGRIRDGRLIVDGRGRRGISLY